MTLERTIENALIRESRRRDVLCLKLAPGNLRGFPDRTLLADGLVCFVEVKRPTGGRLSEHQKVWKTILEENGFQVFICRTQDEAKQIVERFKDGRS